MFSSHINERMAVYTCTLDVEIDGKLSSQVMQAPRIILEQQFMGIINQAIRSKQPILVRMSRKEPYYNQFENTYKEQEYSIEFANNPYIAAHPETER